MAGLQPSDSSHAARQRRRLLLMSDASDDSRLSLDAPSESNRKASCSFQLQKLRRPKACAAPPGMSAAW